MKAGINGEHKSKCSTMIKAVLPMEQVIKYAKGESTVYATLTFTGQCIHVKGESKGNLSGGARKRVIAEVN